MGTPCHKAVSQRKDSHLGFGSEVLCRAGLRATLTCLLAHSQEVTTKVSCKAFLLFSHRATPPPWERSSSQHAASQPAATPQPRGRAAHPAQHPPRRLASSPLTASLCPVRRACERASEPRCTKENASTHLHPQAERMEARRGRRDQDAGHGRLGVEEPREAAAGQWRPARAEQWGEPREGKRTLPDRSQGGARGAASSSPCQCLCRCLCSSPCPCPCPALPRACLAAHSPQPRSTP